MKNVRKIAPSLRHVRDGKKQLPAWVYFTKVNRGIFKWLRCRIQELCVRTISGTEETRVSLGITGKWVWGRWSLVHLATFREISRIFFTARLTLEREKCYCDSLYLLLLIYGSCWPYPEYGLPEADFSVWTSFTTLYVALIQTTYIFLSHQWFFIPCRL